VEANEAEATRYFMEAATRGVASAKAILGVRYMHGTGVPENAKKGIVLLREAAAEGDVFGQQQLAECLTEGIATERNETEAAQWAKKAADAGDAKSQCRYGLFLEYGTGVPKNQAEALKYYLLAAKQGSAWGQRLVGLVCMHGAGVKKNNIEGCNWMKLAANQGDTFAQWILGEAYAEGQGVPRDPTEALKWLVKAGDSGNAAAQSALGLRLLKGNGLQKDLRRAHEWLKRSAQQGDERGQAALAVAYAFGTGVPKNTRIAYFWACLAASQADVQKLHELVTFLEKQLPLQDITDAQRLAAQFVPQPEGEKEQDGSLPGVADSPRITTGSGFFITADGYFVTNFHVVRKSKRIRIKTASGDHGATLVRSDPGNDLAILKVEGEFAALHVRGSKGLRVADRVFTVGYPAPDVQGLTAKYSSGEVASLSGMGDDACRMQISVPIQPGNSGGPLVDSSGSVVGVVDSQWNKAAAIAEKGILPENVNYAIKGTILLGILEAMPEIASSLVREAESETAATAADVAARVEAATGMVVVAK
jgi:TPR repeat protein